MMNQGGGGNLMSEYELYHHGVKGMKWGVRRARPQVSFKRANKMAMDSNAGNHGIDAYGALRESRRQTRKAVKYQQRADKSADGSKKQLKNQYKSNLHKNAANANKKLMNDYNSNQNKAMDYRSKQSYGKTVAKRLLLSNETRFIYDIDRSKGYSRGKAAVDASLKTLGVKMNDNQKAKLNRTKELHEANRDSKAAYKQAKSDRKANISGAKAEYKTAKKEYNKSYGKAYANSYRHPITQYVTKNGKAKSDALWTDAANKAKKVNTTKAAYKQAKRGLKRR